MPLLVIDKNIITIIINGDFSEKAPDDIVDKVVEIVTGFIKIRLELK